MFTQTKSKRGRTQEQAQANRAKHKDKMNFKKMMRLVATEEILSTKEGAKLRNITKLHGVGRPVSKISVI